MPRPKEYVAFERLLGKIARVPSSEVKSKLADEKKARKRVKPSASGRASSDKG
jgi:hypothetical protein